MTALRGSSALLVLPACLLVTACLLLPIAYLIGLSFNPPVLGEVALTDQISLHNYARLLDWFYGAVLLKTLWVSVLTTLISTLLGVALA